MGITIREFQVTMETFGAERLPNREGSRHNISVPCFYLKGIEFLHSGSYYIVQRGHIASEDIMNRAMAELGEKHPGGDNFWWGEIHSIKGILTLAALLKGNYNKELVDGLTNETYKKLLDCSLIKSNVEFPFTSTHSPKMQELRELLAEYSNVVNPFGNCNLKIKEPIGYLNKVKIQLGAKEETDKPYSRLTLSSSSSETHFDKDVSVWSYRSSVPVQKGRKNGYIHITHYYNNGNDNQAVDEVVYLDYNSQRNRKTRYINQPDDIDLRISLKTGLAWITYKEDKAVSATDEQINIMIAHLKMSIKKLRKSIIRNIINKEV